jgi:hypothetical protein
MQQPLPSLLPLPEPVPEPVPSLLPLPEPEPSLLPEPSPVPSPAPLPEPVPSLLPSRKILVELVKNINYNYEQCLHWIIHLQEKFGYITLGHYIRIIEMQEFCREMKDNLLIRAFKKMDYSVYEDFFESPKSLNDLYQRIFILMMIEYVSQYLRLQTFFIWEVIAKFYIEEHLRLLPFDFQLIDSSNVHSTKNKIYRFFEDREINLQQKISIYIPHSSMYDSIMDYFYTIKERSNP